MLLYGIYNNNNNNDNNDNIKQTNQNRTKQTEGKEGGDDKGNKYYQYKWESLDGEEEVEIVTYKDIDTNAYYNVDYNIDEDGNATMNISATSESTGTDKK